MSEGSPRIGLALGGGGARGLAHIPVLQAFDDLGVKPCLIAGTSIGAIFGAAYAAGRPASDIRRAVEEITVEDPGGRSFFRLPRQFGWLDLLSLDVSRGSLIGVEKFLARYMEAIGVATFEELEIPLKLVAADYWTHEEVVFEGGDLRRAVRASMSLPAVFQPVVDGEQVFVDGGCVNPVPFDLLSGRCDVTVAVDVLGRREAVPGEVPSLMDSLFNTFQIMERTITREKRRRCPPTIYLEPRLGDVGMLEFHKAAQIFEDADRAREELRSDLESALEALGRRRLAGS